MMEPPKNIRPWESAPKSAVWITMWSRAKGGSIYPDAVHFAQDLSGREQPPYCGWFSATGHGFVEVSTSMAIGWPPLEEADAHEWPEQLTPALRKILGKMCFEFISLAQLARAAGHDVPTRAEDEQAFWMHRLLGHWFTHGDDWGKAAAADLEAMRAKAGASA